MKQSVRAQIVERRTYLRPTNSQGTEFETPAEAWRRVIDHQKWLWERAKGEELNEHELAELEELYQLFMDRKATVSGRTRWLGGTDIAKKRESSQFNCAFGVTRNIYDVVDSIWLLLQGCGVGFRPDVGILNGFSHEIPELQIIRSKKQIVRDESGHPVSDPALRGVEHNVETFDKDTGIWTIKVGDSAEAWAKFFGKLFAFKGRATKLIVDFSEIRPAGYRLSGYGWISSGDEQIAKATRGIFEVMNRSAGQLLSAIDILDVENHLGTILSSRRSAEIALYQYGNLEWREFATAKKNYFVEGSKTKHRGMSNNSLMFYQKPDRMELVEIFDIMMDAGGSDPGFINALAALNRAAYFKGVNPCAEILLGDKSFCNLVETIVCRFNGDFEGLCRAHYIIARANYRQTCVNLDDGILQRSWHELNEFLRLCGVGVTGVIGWEGVDDPQMQRSLRQVAKDGANGMADELGLPRPKLVTTVKPSGTQSKVAGFEGDEIGEGIHKPLGRYIFNNILFPVDDPVVKVLRMAGYDMIPHPTDIHGVIIKFPVEYTNIDFDRVTKDINGIPTQVEVNLDSAVKQLERYKMWQINYVDHNCSITVSYSPEEVPEIIDWLLENWEYYVGVSFIYRNDPTKTAADLGHAYLPQEVVDERTFREYENRLLPVDLTGTDIDELLQMDDCSTGACPVR